MKLGDVLIRPTKLFPKKQAIKYLDRNLSFAQLYERVCQTASAMRSSGVMPGECVCILCRNCIEYIELIFAAAFAGAIPALINWRFSPAAAYDMIQQTGARLVFLSSSEVQHISYIHEHAAESMRVVLVGENLKGEVQYEDFRRNAAPDFVPEEPDSEATALIIFTSGTSGKAKGVKIANRAIDSQVNRCIQSGLWEQDTVFLCVAPLCHTIGISVMALIYTGGQLLLCPADYVKNIEKLLLYAEENRATSTALVPTVINRIVSFMEDNSLTNNTMRYIHYGAAPMTAKLIKRCSKVFDCKFHQGYGMTETYGTVATLLPEDHLDEKHLQSVGRASGENEIRIIDDSGASLPCGVIGEICVKTKSLMSGYIGPPEKTSEVISDGWYHTADLGYLDEDGYLYLKARKNDMIITGGENVYPQEIERCILELDKDVKAVCVIGLEDNVWGEIIAALVVKREGSKISETQIAEYCADRLGRYKKPKRIVFASNIPLTEMNKISRGKVRDLIKQAEQ